MFTSAPVSAVCAVLLLATAVRGESGCDLTKVYKGASQFLTSLSAHAASLFDGKDTLAGMTVFVPTDKFLDDSGITMFSAGAFQGENALPVMRRHVFPADPFAEASHADGAAVRNAGGALFVTQTRTYASPTNLRISAAGAPLEQGALVHRAGLHGCGGAVTIHIIDRVLPEPTAEVNGVLYTDMERPLPLDPPQCTSLLQVLRKIKGSSTLRASKHIHDLHSMVQPDSGGEATFTVFAPTDAAFKAFETFDPPTYAHIMKDPGLWEQMASLHVAKTTWTQDEGPDPLQLKTLAWCDDGPCMLSASVDDEGQAFVRPVRGNAPEAQASLKGVPFCHGVVYTIDEVLRIDDVETGADAEIAAGAEDVGEPGVEGPGAALEDYADYPGQDYDENYEDGGDVALAPREVLAPREGDLQAAADYAEERGSNETAEDYEDAAEGPEADVGDYGDEYAADETAEAPEAAGDYADGGEEDAADYADAAADYVADDGDDGAAGDYAAQDGGGAEDAAEDDDDILDPGTVVPTKKEWKTARDSGRI